MRGPLKPERSFRDKLILPMFAMAPAASAVVCVLLALFDGQKLEDAFLPSWLTLTPVLLALAFGDFLGRRLAAAIGYHWTILTGRLIEVSVAIATLAAFGIVRGLLDQRAGLLAAALSISILVATGVFGFIRRLTGN